MKITWDKNAHAIYFYLSESAPHMRTQEITDCINIDWDMAGNVQGIEVLGIDNPVIEDITSWTEG